MAGFAIINSSLGVSDATHIPTTPFQLYQFDLFDFTDYGF